MIKRINRLLEVPTTDPEDARRRRLLNILLAGSGILSLIMVAGTALVGLLHLIGSPEEVLPIYYIGGGVFVACIALYMVNRFLSGQLASLAFLILLTSVLPFSDVPREVAAGRTLFAFTIPIVMASVLLRPASTFLIAGLSSLEISLLAFSINDIPNLPAVVGFFMIALVSWLSARSLENALRELVVVNRELDQRVIERTQALSEALARERNEAGRSQAILQGIADGVLVFDPLGRAIVTNPAFETLANRPSRDILGTSLRQWLSDPDLDPKERESVQQLMEHTSPMRGNLKVQWGKKTLAVSVAPVRISSGEMIGRVAVFHDFTREAEVDRMKSDFVAMVSHELRTPLNSIMGYADMLKEGIYGRLEDRQQNIVERVMANTHKLLSIVNDLLDQAQIEAGRLSFHNRNFRPQELLDYVQGVMESIVRAKNLSLCLSVAKDMPATLYGDPQRLNQVLVNLVNNSVKFTEEGQVNIRLYQHDAGHWAMEICDTGVGIPVEAQKTIFEPFRQVSSEVTRRPGGIGLGLSITRRLVDLMQGEVRVQSEVGQGSTFTVILPFVVNEKENS